MNDDSQVTIQWYCPNCEITLMSHSWHTPALSGCKNGCNHSWEGTDVTDLEEMVNSQKFS